MRRGGQGEARGTGREYARQTEVRRANTQRKTECRERFARADGGRKTEKYNVTEVGRRRDEQGATKERKGAEFLKDLYLRAGFGIMER